MSPKPRRAIPGADIFFRREAPAAVTERDPRVVASAEPTVAEGVAAALEPEAPELRTAQRPQKVTVYLSTDVWAFLEQQAFSIRMEQGKRISRSDIVEIALKRAMQDPDFREEVVAATPNRRD